MEKQCQSLFEITRLLYEKYRENNQQEFNIFSVLRTSSDEVNLHSRFLAALLDYQTTATAQKENLKSFLKLLGLETFNCDGARVRRESNNIDVLVTNNGGQAVVIENKIYASDQDRQLERYWMLLNGQGYKEIYLVYLTLDGKEPSEESLGQLKKKTDLETKLLCISYGGDLPDWLLSCQQKACDEPGLRESISQYIKLIHKLTGTDMNDNYRNELSSLLKRDNNLLLAHDLVKAMTTAQIDLQLKLWDEIDTAMVSKFGNRLSPKSAESEIPRSTVRAFYQKAKNNRYYGMYYPFASGDGMLGIEIYNSIYFGVCCNKQKHPNEHSLIQEALSEMGGSVTKGWPFYKYSTQTSLNLKNPSRDELKLLSDDDARKAYAEEIAEEMYKICKTLEEAGLEPLS